MRWVEKSNAGGRPVAVSDLVRAARLRSSGIRGEGGEDAIMARALNHHFNCVAPAGWHFTVRRKKGQRWYIEALQAETKGTQTVAASMALQFAYSHSI